MIQSAYDSFRLSVSPTDNSIDLICPECGYDLRGIQSPRCPECGAVFDRASASVGCIPWAHRRAMGIFRAYWRTVLLGSFRPTHLAEAIAAPVSFADARRFRLSTVLVASFAPALLFIYAIFDSVRTG